MDHRLSQHRSVWETKSVLREVYYDYYRRIINVCDNGPTLEIGGGSGNIKEYIPDVISIDILFAPWLDVIADAQKLPIRENSFQNIILFDVLHHIESPIMFFTEASRILKPGGTIVILEPAITPVSWFFYHYFHQEPVDLKINPLADTSISINRDPFESNQAIPTLLFGKYLTNFYDHSPELKVINKEWLSLFAYPLSGGFKKWSLISKKMVVPILNFEKWLTPILGKIMGFRLFVVLKKNLVS